jgi:hypothetical protein
LFFAVLLAVLLLTGGQAAISPARSEARQHVVDNRLLLEGQPVVTQGQAVAFVKSVHPSPRLQCSIEDLVRYYYQEGAREGIRADLAISQALLETGFFRYGGAVQPEQNNFCGLGSVSGGHRGASFATPEIGVRAHIQHLLAYASKRPPRVAIVDPRYKMVTGLPQIFGSCHALDDLDGKWAAGGVPYSARIRNIYERMLATKAPPETAKKPEPERKKDEKPLNKEQQPQINKKHKNKAGKKGLSLKERVAVILKEG